MQLDEKIFPVQEGDRLRLVEVWEASVRATHRFLTETDIQYFKPFVRDGLIGAMSLSCIRDISGQLVAFVGVDGEKLEALFVDPVVRAKGLGRRLLEYAVYSLGARTVDVNEQNEQAVGFYLRMGFDVVGRSELDSSGKPFPLLHMQLHRHGLRSESTHARESMAK
ncbi:GNAT family N-acetyltransferase [Noviherbaspirillum sp.]|uniref:GNAT family N-acetyltransferase n=1 Tax=Noviherbaspirillum sp. TaxID=1926288 RepID=UPI002DDC98A2|nr:GNAT family N-acetyltransferase [Noviherbaspirillum sp.]